MCSVMPTLRLVPSGTEHRTRASAHFTSSSSTAPTPTLHLPFFIFIFEMFEMSGRGFPHSLH